MGHLIETDWVWSLLALGCGAAVGYQWLPRLYRQTALAWAVVALVTGVVVAGLQLVPGPAGLYLETLLLLLWSFLVGLLIGGWLRRSTVLPQARAGASRPADAAVDARLAAQAKATQAAGAAAAAKAAEDASQAKAVEEARVAATAKAAEEARLAAQVKAAEEARVAAAAKAAEEARLAAQLKTAEETRAAATAKAAEDARRTAQANAAEGARAAATAKAAEDAGIAAPVNAADAPNAVAQPGAKPAGIAEPHDGKADDLKLIKGIGPINERLFHDLGVYHFVQIADWTADEATWVGHHIAFPGRIEREHWIDQARLLASGGDTAYSAGVKAGTIAVDATADAPLSDAEATALGASLPAQAAAVEGESDHHGRRPYGLLSPRQGSADHLQRIRGIGPQNEKRLHALGIWHFDQIAAWSTENVAWVGSYLAFPGRIDREKWITQAKDLAAGRDDGLPPKGRRRNGVR